MEPLRQTLILAIFLAFISTVLSISCRTYNEKDVVCEAGSTDQVLRRGLVSDNNKTTGITLRRCRITDLDYEAFQNDFNLRYSYIDLSLNKISRLKLGVLDGNQQVTYLNLSYNLLTSFPLGLFDQKINLDLLDFKGNKLESIEPGLFKPLTKLNFVDLSSNNILGKNLNTHIFDQSKRITFMDFSRNDMSNSPELLLHAFEALDFLNLDRCSLTEVPAFATRPNLRTMKHLMLSTNKISRLDNNRMFMNLDDLEILNLAYNQIEKIAADVFEFNLKKLKMIVLTNNRLKTIPDFLFSNLNQLGNLDLSQNLIEYMPLNAIRGTALNILNLSYNRFTYLEANFCLELRNAGVSLSKLYVNENPWQCACMNEILREMKKFNIRYNSNKLNGYQAVCVTTKQFICKRQKVDNVYFSELYDEVINNDRG